MATEELRVRVWKAFSKRDREIMKALNEQFGIKFIHGRVK